MIEQCSFWTIFSGPQYANVIMDEYQLLQEKINIKNDCDCEFQHDTCEYFIVL